MSNEIFAVHDRLLEKIGLVGVPVVFGTKKPAVKQWQSLSSQTKDQRDYSFWKKKFEENTSRDFRNNRLLLNSGWRIAIVWDCQLRGKQKGNCTNILADWLRGNETILEIPDFARKLKSGAA